MPKQTKQNNEPSTKPSPSSSNDRAPEQDVVVKQTVIAPGKQDVIAEAPVPAVEAPVPWLTVAYKYLHKHVQEQPGPTCDADIARWLKAVGQPSSDEIPWCAAFANGVLTEAGFQGTGSAAARSFLKWGTKCEPKLGAVVVFWRGDETGQQGHVGFVVDFHPAGVLVLGGNQGNRVSIASMTTTKVLGFRWPKEKA